MDPGPVPRKQASPHQGSAGWVMIMLHYNFIIDQKPKLNKMFGKESQLLLQTQTIALYCICASFSPMSHGLLEYRDLLYLSLGLSLGPSPPHRDALWSGLEQLLKRSKWSWPRDVRSSCRHPGRTSMMECLFPVLGLGSHVYSTMTDRHKMEWRVSTSSPASSQAAWSCCASTNEAVQETALDKVQL